jgi:antitoxin component YwqK of YwqJK toxin-antitoxin module
MEKYIAFMIAVFSFVMCCDAQSDTVFNQVDANGIKQKYWKIMMTENGKTYFYAIENFKDGRRNGLCIYFFSNGKKREESQYRNDTLDGFSKTYRSYGGLRYEENFKDGRTHGFKKYYSVDGDLAEEQEYTNGAESGVYRLYSKTKRVIVESFFIDGLENGIRKVYSDNESHEIIREFDFKNGVRIASRYYKKGKLTRQEKFDYEEELRKDEELKKKNHTVDG